MSASIQLSFNRTTTASVADLFDDGLDQGGGGHQSDFMSMHFRQEALARGIDEIDVAEVQNSDSAAGGGGCRLPALAQFFDPGAGEAALEVEPEFAGAVVEGDFEHAHHYLGQGGCQSEYHWK